MDQIDEINKRLFEFDDDLSTDCYKIICELRWCKLHNKEQAYYEFNKIIRKDHIKEWNRRFKNITERIINDYGERLGRQKWVITSYCGFSFKDKFDELWSICGSKPKWLNS
jgi:hypothetical protein